jgi:hypothetical protein
LNHCPDRHKLLLGRRGYWCNVKAEEGPEAASAAELETDGSDMAARMTVPTRMGATNAALRLGMLGDHSRDDSWKQRVVQGHGDVSREAHGRCVQQPTAVDETDMPLQAHARLRTKPDDVEDMAGPCIQTEPGGGHDDLEDGNTARLDPEGPETLRLLYPALDWDMKCSDACSLNLTAAAEAAARNRIQTWQQKGAAAAACGAIDRTLVCMSVLALRRVSR